MGVSVTKIEEALFRIEDCIPLPQAEKLFAAQGFKISKVSLISWLRHYPIGMKVGGRWWVHPDSLALLLAGKMKKRLQPLSK
jgi:hypothetical protein